MVPTRILVAVDFGEMSLPTLAYGRQLAAAFSAELHVLHVAPNIVAASSAEGFTPNFAVVQGEIEAGARKQLEALLSADVSHAVRAVSAIRCSNAPAEAILDYARNAGIDLLVVGAHASAITPHMLMGSTAERLVRVAPCPVLTVRPMPARAARREREVAATA